MYYTKRGVLIISIFILFLPFVFADSIFISNESDFNRGGYVSTVYSNSSKAVTLVPRTYFGNYTLTVDAGREVEWNDLAWKQNTNSVLVLVDSGEDVGKSVNLGTTWIKTHSDFNSVNANAVDLVSLSNGTLVIVDLNEDIWTSSDFGYSWNKINDDYNYAENQDASVMIRDGNDRLYIFETDEDVWRSDTYGVTWTKISVNFDQSISTANARGAVTSTNNTLFTITSDGDVYTSLDLGVRWTELTSDYNLGEPDLVSDLSIDSNDSLYTLSGQALWKSSNGATWNKLTNDFNGVRNTLGRLILFDTVYSYIVDGAENLYVSKDLGITWTLLNSNLNGPNGDILSMSYYTMPSLSFGVTTNNTIIPAPSFNLTGQNLTLVSYFTTYDLDYSPLLYNLTLYYNPLPRAPDGPRVYSPFNGSVFSNDAVTLSVGVSDSDSSSLEVSFYSNTSLLNRRNVSNGSTINYTWSPLAEGTYSWYVLVSDGTKTTTSETYYFSVDFYPSLVNLYNYTSNDSVLLTFESSELANATILYGENLSLLTRLEDPRFLLNHSISLPNLTNATNYYYFITYCDTSYHCLEEGPYTVTTTQNPFIDTISPVITLLSPLEDSYDLDGEILFEFGVYDDSSFNCSLLVNSSPFIDLTTNSFALNLTTGYYPWSISCRDSYNNIGISEPRNLFSKLSLTTFNGNTTDLTRITDWSSVNLSLHAVGEGRIDFLSLINLTDGANFDEGVTINTNYVFVNSTSLPTLSTPARITLENLTFLNPLILRDEATCIDCVISSYREGTLVFTVHGFSSYTIAETPSISSSDSGGSGGGGSTLVTRGDFLGRGEDEGDVGVRETVTGSETIRRDISDVDRAEPEAIPLISGFTVLIAEPLPRLSLTFIVLGVTGLGVSYGRTYLSSKPRKRVRGK